MVGLGLAWTGTAAEEKLTPLAEVLRDSNGDFVPDHLGETFTVAGALTSDPGMVSSYGGNVATLAHFQDRTGGIVLFTRDPGLLSKELKRGDTLQVKGKLSQHNGMDELVVTRITRLGAGPVPPPHEVLVADLNGERYSGQLVRVTGSLVVPPEVLSRKRDLILRDRSGQIPVLLSDPFFADPVFASRLRQGGEVELIGLASQSDKDAPFDSGYRVAPRDPADFIFAPVPPYRLVAGAAMLAGLAGLAAFLWRRRRRAEIHARELSLLTRTLSASEEALRLSEERFRRVFEDGPVGIFIGGPDLKLLQANRAFCQFLSYEERDLVGLSFAEITHPDDAARSVAQARRLFGGEVAGYQLDNRYLTRSGEVLWTKLTVSRLGDREGKPLYALGVVEDLTHRKRIEEMMAQSEKRFRALIEKSSDCITLINLEGVVVYDAEPATRRNLGYSKEEVLGRKAFDLVHPDDIEKIRSLFDDMVRQSGATLSAQYRVRHRDGSWHWMEGTGTNWLADPSVAAIVINARDITERKRSEERFQLVAHATNDAVWDWDLKSNQVWWNEGIQRLFGYAPQLAGHDASWWDQLIHPDDKDRILADMQSVLAGGGQYWSAEYRYRRADGSYADVFDRGYVLKDERGQPVRMIGAMMDITERKRVERELAKARDEALESARLKSDFLANISHEVRTPLNGIIGMTVLLQDSLLTSEQRGFARTIQSSADALLAIINDILDFSKIEAGKLQFETLDFDLRATVESTIELLAERAQRKQIELVSLIQSEVPLLLRGDPGRLRQVITNLVVNAIKFTERGEVVLRVARERETGTHTTLCFTVKDTGIGILQDALPHLFHAFYQADGSTTRKYGGTGLGLAISKQLVEMMGGQIGVESTAGMGSTFWFTVQFEKQAGASQPAPESRALLAGRRVLIVDDNETNRSILMHQTTALGMRADCAATAEESLHKLRAAAAQNDPYPLALLDLQMAGMDGLGLARAIKSDLAITSTRLLLMTSLGPRNDTAQLRAAGIGAFLVKPVKQTQLLECLMKLMTASSQHETRFWLNRNETASRPTETRGESSRRCHILVAEDNPINQKVAVGLLGKLGYRAEAVANGLEVLRAMELVSYDIIFMDCQLPELDGYKTTMEIRRRESSANNGARRRVHIIAMTAHAVRGAREKCLAAGMDDYISKPVQLEALRAVLDNAIRAVRQPAPAPANPAPSPPVATLDQSALVTLRTLRKPDKPDPVIELIDIFLKDAPDKIRELQTAAAQYNGCALELIAHSLRGCASSVGATRMARLCSELEEQAHAGSIQTASHLLKQLEHEFASVRAALEIEKLA